MRHRAISLRTLCAAEDGFAIRLLFIKMVWLGEKAHLLTIRLPIEQALLLVQWSFAIRKRGEGTNTIVHWAEYRHGGHYTVMTVPKDWLKDVREFFCALRIS
jgi:hypothetical protein